MSEEIVEQLKRSREIIGEVNAMVVDYDGEVLSGQHREKAGWTKVHNVDSRVLAQKWKVTPQMAKYMLRLHLNIQRKPSREETQILLLKLAKEMQKKGIETDNISSELRKLVPYSQRWIEMLLPPELKKLEKAEAGKLGAEVLRQKMLAELVECERCHMATREAADYKGMTLCPRCLEKAKYTPAPKPSEEKPKVTTTIIKPKEKWEHRRAVMAPQVSKMEEAVLIALEQKGLHPEVQKQFCLQSTTPDYYFADRNLAVYLDGSVHKGREDRDEALRELLGRRHGLKIVSILYEGMSQDEIVSKILNVVNEEG